MLNPNPETLKNVETCLRSDRLDSLQKRNFNVDSISEHTPEPGPQACPLRLSAFQRPILQLPRWGSYLPPENQNLVLKCHSSCRRMNGYWDLHMKWSIYMGQKISEANIAAIIVNTLKSIVFLEHLKNPHCKTFYKDYSLHCLDSLGICRLRTFWDSITDQHEKISRSTLELLRWRQ